MIAVELRQVSKCFGDVHAVRDVTLSVAAGERLAVVGPSGCGKTTLLRLIAGLESPDRGEVAFDGRVVNAVPPHQRGVAMVFQNYALYPHMTVYDNLGFGLRCRRVARRTIRARIREVAERLRVADILHRQPAELSGGQRQRVALGRAWVGEAGVLLLDEPMSHLDAQHRERMRRELLTHLDQGPVTTLYVTHDQEEALALGQRVAVMNAGGLQQVGTPAEVYRYPANRFVAEFLGMPTMNFIEGEIVRGSAESLCFRTLDGDLPLPDSARSLKLSAPALVVLGVRPQDLHFTRQTSIPGLPFYVEAMAFQGSQTLVYLKTPQGTPLTLCTASDTQLQVGQRGICTPVMDRIHLFAPGPFGENLLPPTHPVP